MRRKDESPTNALTFDLEHWHSATLLSPEVDDPIDRIEDSVSIVLDVLRRHDVRATFFVVGEVAEEYPELVRRIDDEGHELGSHGHTHTPLFDLTPDEFAEELSRSAGAIERASGREPVGFRAPNFSVTRATDWAFRVLESSDYAYDSSVFPAKTPMYGVSDAPRRPYDVALDDPFRAPSTAPSRDALIEFPLSVVDVGIRLPIAGGFYARVTPTWLLKRGIDRINDRGIPANIYFHPWECNPDVPVDDVPLHKRLVSFYGIENTEAKIDELLTEFDFGTALEALESHRADRPDFRGDLDSENRRESV